MDPAEVSKTVKIQAAWRGKRERKSLKKKVIAATEIQRIVRGFFAKRTFTSDIESYREQKKLRKDQKKRLVSIRNREYDLRMLAQISPEQYFAYDKLRQERAAKAIQRTWRNKQFVELRPKKSSLDDYYHPTASHLSYGYKAAKIDRLREKEIQKSRELYSSLSKNDPLLEKVNIFYKDIVSSHKAKVDSSFSPRVDDRLDIKPEDLALGLDQLFQNIRSQAIQRQTEEGKSNVTSFGNYRELLKQRQRMEVLLGDYYASKDDSEYNKIDRVKSLLHSQRLMQDMQSLPTLNDVTAMLKKDAGGILTEEEQKRLANTRGWFEDHPEDFLTYLPENQEERLVNDLGEKEQGNIIRKSIYGHLQMTQQLTEARWKTFLLPIHVNGDSKVPPQDRTLQDSLCVEEHLDKPTFVMSALPTKFDSAGTSAEDSLKWVSYCLNGITNDTVPKELRTLRNRVLHSALHPHAYRDAAEIALERENAEIRRKAKILEQRVILELKAQAMQKLGKAFALSTRQQEEKSAIIIQSAMRAHLTRRRVRELISRRRIDKALHQLLHEVAQMEGGKDQRFSHLSNILLQPASMLNAFLPQPPAVSSAGKEHRQRQQEMNNSQQQKSAARDPVQTSLEKYTLRSMLSPLMPPTNNQFTPRNTSGVMSSTPYGAGLLSNKTNHTTINTGVKPYGTNQLHYTAVPPLSAQPLSSLTTHAGQTPAIRSIWEDKRLYEADSKEQKVADETPLHKRGDLVYQPVPSLQAFSTSAPNTGRKQPEPPTIAPPSNTARSIKSVQFATQPLANNAAAVQSPPATARSTTSVRTPVSARGTPANRNITANGPPHSAISSAGGDLLSPFMGLTDMHGDDEGYGYISTPSLSRSLTESFGKVDTSRNK